MWADAASHNAVLQFNLNSEELILSMNNVPVVMGDDPAGYLLSLKDILPGRLVVSIECRDPTRFEKRALVRN